MHKGTPIILNNLLFDPPREMPLAAQASNRPSDVAKFTRLAHPGHPEGSSKAVNISTGPWNTSPLTGALRAPVLPSAKNEKNTLHPLQLAPQLATFGFDI